MLKFTCCDAAAQFSGRVQAQVLQFETDTAGQLRPEEIRQAELLMESVGELDPNAR